MDRLADGGSDLVKFRNLEPDEVRAVGEEARRRGLPLAGHAPHMDPGEAAELGVRSLEHAETVSLALADRTEPERLASMVRIARAGAFITPTLVNFRVNHLSSKERVADWLAATSRDPERRGISAETLRVWRVTTSLKVAEGFEDWQAFYARQVADTRLAVHAGVQLLAGTDLGSVPGEFPGSSLHEELEILVHEVGLTPGAALRTAPLGAHRFFGNRTGAGDIAPRERADLLLLTANPLVDIANARRIRAVVLAGRLLNAAMVNRLSTAACAPK